MDKQKIPGYLNFDDSKSVLKVFAQEDKDLGYELAMEISYGSDRGYVEKIIETISKLIDLENLREIVQSDKFLIKFK